MWVRLFDIDTGNDIGDFFELIVKDRLVVGATIVLVFVCTFDENPLIGTNI